MWSRAGSELTLSGTTSGRDSALGSASLLGEGSGFFAPEDEEQLAAEATAAGGAQPSRLGVSRSVSLPDQLSSFGAGGGLAIAVGAVGAALAQDGGAATRSEEDTRGEDCEVQSISESMLPLKL